MCSIYCERERTSPSGLRETFACNRLAVERGPGIAFWLLALAAQMSGYTNVAIALALVGVAIFFLLAPVYHHVRKWHEKRRLKGRALEPNHLILIGVIGTVLFAGIGAAGFIWQYLRGPQPVSGALYWSAASSDRSDAAMACPLCGPICRPIVTGRRSWRPLPSGPG
jgi:hypothetical protein